MSGSRNFKKTVLLTAVFACAMSAMMVGSLCYGAAKPAGRGLLGTIPGDSMFCVRVGGLQGTLDAANEFLKGVAPEPFDAKAEVFTKLGNLLGNEKLTGVNKKGGIAIFGVDVPQAQVASDGPARGPMGNMFIGALVSVGKYENFVSRNPNCSEPDADGVSTITVDDKPRALAVNVGRFALLCPPNARDKLPGVMKLMAQRKASLQRALDEDDRKMATSCPILLYLNVKAGSKLVEPMIAGKLGQIKAELQKAKEKGKDAGPFGPGMVNPAGIIELYAGIFKMVLAGTDHIMIGLTPTTEACNVTVGVTAVPGTDFAATVGSPVEGDLGDMLAHLDNGAIMNLAGKIDQASFKSAYMKLIDLMGKMAPGAVSTADLEAIKKLTAKAIDATGDSLVMSFGPTGTSSPAVAIKYMIKVDDEKALREVVEEQLQMMRDGSLGRLYKGFGMDLSFDVEHGSETYKGINIDTAKIDFNLGGNASEPTEMIKKIYGDKLDYRWAFVDGYCVYTIGGGSAERIRELIDQIRAGGVKETGSEMKTALELLPESDNADVVGAFNYVRMLNMVMNIIPIPEGESRPKLDVPTAGNIAFAGRTITDGKMVLQVVLPKAHLIEIKTAFETLIPQIKKQEELQRQKRKERKHDA